MRANMDIPRPQFPRVLDGYSIHVYWDPGDELIGFPRKLEKRLENLPKTLRELGIDRPLYVTEYGVKKQGAPRPEPGGRGSGPDESSSRPKSRSSTPGSTPWRRNTAASALPSGSSAAPMSRRTSASGG